MSRKIKIGAIWGLVLANLALIWLNFLQINTATYQRVHDKLFSPTIQIYMAYYKPFRLPPSTRMIKPIQVGRTVEKEPFMGGELSDEDIDWLHKNMIGDDTGDNISAKNRVFDILTAYYWVWKHYEEIGNPQYIGFFSHRKILTATADENYRLFNHRGMDYGLDEATLAEKLKKARVIASIWQPFENDDWISYYDSWKIYHHIEDLNLFMDILVKEYPEMREATQYILFDDELRHGFGNYFIMEKELAFDYFEKLFNIMFQLEARIGGDIARQEYLYSKRVIGFLAERFFAIWLYYQEQTKQIKPEYVKLQYLI